MEDLAIIDTDDAILIIKKDMSQRVKDIVNLLKKDGHPSVLEHKTVFRHWGSYTVYIALKILVKFLLKL